MRNIHTFFMIAPLYIPTNKAWGVPFLDILTNTFIVVVLLMIVFLTGTGWYLVVILICIGLMLNYVEKLFICLLAISMSSLGKCLFRSYTHFKNKIVWFLMLTCMSCLYILDINPLSGILFEISSPIQWVVFLCCPWFPLLGKSF